MLLICWLPLALRMLWTSMINILNVTYHGWNASRRRHNTEWILWVNCSLHLWSYDRITNIRGCSANYDWISLLDIIVMYRGCINSNPNLSELFPWLYPFHERHGLNDLKFKCLMCSLRRWWCPSQPQSSTTGSIRRFSSSRGGGERSWTELWNPNFLSFRGPLHSMYIYVYIYMYIYVYL